MSKIDEMIRKLCPDGVERVKLVNVANVLYGCPFDATLFSEDDSFIPLIRIRDVVTGVPSTYYSGEYSEQYIIHKGDILVGMDGNFNLGRWNDRDGVLCQRTCKIESKDKKIILNNYLFHLLGPIFKVIEDNTPGGSVKHLSAKVINEIEIPLPPLSIQQEIVSVLDSFTTLIDKTKQAVEKRKKQMEYYREELLTFEDGECEWKTLGELGYSFNGLTGKSKKDFENGNSVFITYSNIFNNPELNLEIPERVMIYEGEKQNTIQKGDILFTGSSETPDEAGMSSVVLKTPDEKMYLNSFCFGLRLYNFDSVKPNYMKHLLRSNRIRESISKTAFGVTRFNINKDKFLKVEIPIPPITMQSSIVSTLDKFESYITKLEKMITLRQKQYEYYREKLLTFV